MPVELRHVRAFLAIADSLNLTRAAETLHITQPSLTRSRSTAEQITLDEKEVTHLEEAYAPHRPIGHR